MRSLARLLGVVRSRPRLRRRAWRLEGVERCSGRPLSVLCTAKSQTRNYLAELLFSDSARETDLGYLWLWNLTSSRWARKRGCAVVMIEIDSFVEKFLKDGDWFVIPLFVLGTAALPIPDDRLKDKSVVSDLQKIRNAGLRARVTKDPQLFDDFYHNIYVPHVTRTHGSHVYVIPYEDMRGRFAECELVLIDDGVRDVAGMLLLYENDRPRLWAAGVRDGDRRYLKQGALSAAYLSSFQHLTERRFASATLGMSRTFLNNGVLRYKRKWGQRIIEASRGKIALRVTADTPASRSVLQSQPFIFERSGELCAAVFLPEETSVTAEGAARLKKQHFHDGLSKLILFTPRPGGTPDGVDLPAGVSVEPLRRPRRAPTLD